MSRTTLLLAATELEQIEKVRFTLAARAGIDVGEMRGFSIAEFPLPAITVNSKDVLAGRTFTVLHELSHLALRITGLCDMIEIAPRPPEEQRVEVYCNAVAAAALMPRNAFLAERPAKEKRRPDDRPDDVLKTVGDKYGTLT